MEQRAWGIELKKKTKSFSPLPFALCSMLYAFLLFDEREHYSEGRFTFP